MCEAEQKVAAQFPMSQAGMLTPKYICVWDCNGIWLVGFKQAGLDTGDNFYGRMNFSVLQITLPLVSVGYIQDYWALWKLSFIFLV